MSVEIWKNRLNAYEDFLGLKRPFQGLLVTFPALSALWLATHGRPALSLVMIVAMAALLASASVAAFQTWLNARKSAKSQSGEKPAIHPNEALLLSAVTFIAGGIFLALISWTTVALYAIACALAVSLCLSLTLASLLPTYFLAVPRGAILSLPIPIAFLATTGGIPWFAWAYLGVNLLLVAACDLQSAGTPVVSATSHTFARNDALKRDRFMLGALIFCFAAYFLGMVTMGYCVKSGGVFWGALIVAALFAAASVGQIVKKWSANPLVMPYRYWISLVVFAGIACDYAARFNALPDIYR